MTPALQALRGSPVHLRAAGPQDVEALVAIDVVNPASWSQRHFERAIGVGPGGGRTVIVAQNRDQLDGFIVYSQVLDEASIHNIAVRRRRRGQGLGRLLIDESLAQMKSAGATRCLLEVRQSNALARRLYESVGFALDGERKDYYSGDGDREHALLMSRNL